jgi:hypothetical protein
MSSSAAVDEELLAALRTLAIKRRAVGDVHRSLVPTLTLLSPLLERAGDVAAARQTLELRLRIVHGEAEREVVDLVRLGGVPTAPSDSMLQSTSVAARDASLVDVVTSSFAWGSLPPLLHARWMREVGLAVSRCRSCQPRGVKPCICVDVCCVALHQLANATFALAQFLFQQNNVSDAQPHAALAVRVLEALFGEEE